MSLSLYRYHSDSESLYGFQYGTEHVPHVAWEHYRDDHDELRRREDLWATSAEYSFLYALYALDILKARFPEGEPAIATSAEYSYLYAKYVLEERFPQGEPAIAGDAEYSYGYARYALEERFPAGEPAIAEDAKYSFLYAVNVLKNRFQAGEPAIRGSGYQQDYEQRFGIKL